MRSNKFVFILVLALAGCTWFPGPKDDGRIVGQEEAVLTAPPQVPPPITRRYSTKVIVHMEVKEQVMRLADGVKYEFWTFGGTVPGKFIRVRQGDEVEFHLSNHPDNKMPHDIDLHAVTGPGGGAASSFTAPGHTSVFSFKALKAGLFVYHCAMAPVGMHIANGMYGMILVEPKEGLPKVDHEYYIMQSEIYTKGTFGQPGLQAFDADKALAEKPTYVIFNGAVGSLTGDNALQAKVGEKVRIFVGDGGPNLTSSFHVIGEIFDKVYPEAGTNFNKDVQTTVIPPGGAAIAEFTLKVPGTFSLVDHAVFRAFNQGAVAQLNVTGAEDKSIYSGKIRDEIYAPGAPAAMAPQAALTSHKELSRAEQMEMGGKVFKQNCMACHQINGQGIPHTFPPLARSNILNSDKARVLRIVTGGLTGPVKVNGDTFNGVMPAWASLSDDDIANVLTYVYGSWGNSGKVVKPNEVRQTRAAEAAGAKIGETGHENGSSFN